MNDVLIAVIGAAGGVICALISAKLTSRQMTETVMQQFREQQQKMDKQLAVTDTKIEELTREVREHNGFAKRMPVVEEQIRVANHRIEDLEHYHK